MNQTQSKVKLSIIMMAYNQGRFIDEAIASVAAQYLPFDWELLIGDDCSTDSTEESIQPWLTRYPDNIFYHRNADNIGLHRNYESLVLRARGEYLALLEADDYWPDSEKCIKQIEFLDENLDVAWCTTDGKIVDEVGNTLKTVKLDLPRKFDLAFYVRHFFNPLNNSTVIRRSMEPVPYPDYFFKVKQWDTVLYYLRSLRGNIGHLPIKGLAWRRHEGATSYSAGFSGVSRYKDWIIINREIGKLMPKQLVGKYFNNTWAYEKLAIAFWKNREIVQFCRFALLMIITNDSNLTRRLRDLFWSIRNT